ncbi:PAS domain S-box-containing protein [Murinocardiopsis flavida]|uniref:PAS domain S-box-containing protein n=1 Tax=Murinocardiopsis flavida TaxID=645275 RepID=A0A2P8DU29_9ACTN|nr:PAS domain S-box-containing protein [Murinocardiopsis flavida]
MSTLRTETSVPLSRESALGPADPELLASLLRDAPIGFALFDPAARVQTINPVLADACGRSVPECTGSSLDALFGAGSAAAHQQTIAAVLAGAGVVHSEHPLNASGGTGTRWALSWLPVHSAGSNGTGGRVQGVVLLAVAQEVDEAALRRSEERYRSLLKAGNQVIWAAGPDGRMHEDCPEWRGVTGQSEAEFLGLGWLDTVHADDRAAVERAWDDAVADRTPFDATFRVRVRSGEYRHYRSYAVALLRDGELTEWVGANTDVTTQREADEMRQRLTAQLGEAALRTVRLQKATSDLAEALTVDEVVRVMGEIGRSAVGVDRTAVAMLDPERLRLKILNPEGVPDIPGAPSVESGLDYPSTLAVAVRERRPFIAQSPLELRTMLDDEPEVRTFLAHTDEQAWVTLPLLSAGLPMGALRFAFTSPREVSDEEKVFLEALAGQCALALERATLFEREHRTAEALQQSLLPEELPEVKGIGMRSFYRPGTRHVQVGGDWYDAFPLPDGRVAGVLGDVMGKGIKAATGMSRVRNALRALAFSMPEPADVLNGLDRLFEATEAMDQVTTLVYFVLDPETGQIDLSNAGHLPPLVVPPGSAPWLLETDPDTPLGVHSERGHHKFFVPPGNTVVLYSDGLVENRRRAVATGLDELVAVAAQASAEVVGDPQKMLDYLVESMLAGYEQDDDVTLLAVHLPVARSAPEG